MHQHLPYGTQQDFETGVKLELSAHAQLSNRHRIKTHLNLPHGRDNWNTVAYILKLLLFMIRVEWMKGICHLWSRGRLISPSLPVGDDWYLNLSSQKRPTGRNLGGNRLVRRSGATSRGTALLPFYLRMRSFLRTEFHTICVGKSIRLGSTRNILFSWVLQHVDEFLS